MLTRSMYYYFKNQLSLKTTIGNAISQQGYSQYSIKNRHPTPQAVLICSPWSYKHWITYPRRRNAKETRRTINERSGADRLIGIPLVSFYATCSCSCPRCREFCPIFSFCSSDCMHCTVQAVLGAAVHLHCLWASILKYRIWPFLTPCQSEISNRHQYMYDFKCFPGPLT
jgi:hypothetical protein